jgi:hypothetical protein
MPRGSKRTAKGAITGDDARLVELFRSIASGDAARALQMLAASPALATARASVGASADSAKAYFLTEIAHYFYAGDTALHIAAASYDTAMSAHLIELGAALSARNRRGAEPLHYAADANREGAPAQARTIACLCAAGADPNALDRSGVAPLHRAVRSRGAAAVEALLSARADPRLKNGSGSTPLHLAVQNTGRGGTGNAHSVERQKRIISLLLEHGAAATDTDGRGRSVVDSARAPWIRSMLDTVGPR